MHNQKSKHSILLHIIGDMNFDFYLLFYFFVKIPEPDASILSITIDREASYMAAVNNQVNKNIYYTL